ncbi:MAG: TatD family hydrolase [Bacteroidota bacterium]
MNYIDIHTHSYQQQKGLIQLVSYFAKDIPQLVGGKIQHYFSVGIHPWYISPCCYPLELKLMEGIADKPNLLAFGECGLDKSKGAEWDLQEAVFIEQAQLAARFRKPLMVHCVKAFNELVLIRTQYNFKNKWLVHGFNGSVETALQLIEKGCYLSFGKAILDSNFRLKDHFMELPFDRIFLETDAGDLDIRELYVKAAELGGISQETLQQRMEVNFDLIFLRHE